MRRIASLASLIALFALATTSVDTGAVPRAGAPDLIVHDAVVLTMDPDMPRASAFAVRAIASWRSGATRTSSHWSAPAPP